MGNLGIDKRIASTQHLIDLAEQAERDHSPMQSITDFFSSSHELGRENLEAAIRHLQESKKLAEQEDLKKAARFERLAFEAVHEFHRDTWDSQRSFIEVAQPVAQTLMTAGDSLFTIGVTGAVAAWGLPQAMALASKGFSGFLLGWTGLVAGGASGLALASVGKREVQTWVGGEEHPLDETLMRKDLREGINLASFNFLAPYAAALGQSWGQGFSGLTQQLVQLLPFSLLQSGHSAAYAMGERGGIREVAIAAGTGAVFPYLFHGLERLIQLPTSILTRLRKGKAIELYQGARANQDTAVEEAIERAKELFRLNDQEIANAKLVKERYREIIRQKHSDLGGSGNTAEMAELTALRDLLISGENSPLAQAYVQGKIPRATRSRSDPSSKIEVVDLSNDLAVSKNNAIRDAIVKSEAPFASLWKPKKFLKESLNLAGQILARQTNSSSPPSPLALDSTAIVSLPTNKNSSAASENKWMMSGRNGPSGSGEDPFDYNSRKIAYFIHREEKNRSAGGEKSVLSFSHNKIVPKREENSLFLEIDFNDDGTIRNITRPRGPYRSEGVVIEMRRHPPWRYASFGTDKSFIPYRVVSKGFFRATRWFKEWFSRPEYELIRSYLEEDPVIGVEHCCLVDDIQSLSDKVRHAILNIRPIKFDSTLPMAVDLKQEVEVPVGSPLPVFRKGGIAFNLHLQGLMPSDQLGGPGFKSEWILDSSPPTSHSTGSILKILYWNPNQVLLKNIPSGETQFYLRRLGETYQIRQGEVSKLPNWMRVFFYSHQHPPPTRLNGKILGKEWMEIKTGDQIQFGKVKIDFFSPQSADSPFKSNRDPVATQEKDSASLFNVENKLSGADLILEETEKDRQLGILDRVAIKAVLAHLYGSTGGKGRNGPERALFLLQEAEAVLESGPVDKSIYLQNLLKKMKRSIPCEPELLFDLEKKVGDQISPLTRKAFSLLHDFHQEGRKAIKLFFSEILKDQTSKEEWLVAMGLADRATLESKTLNDMKIVQDYLNDSIKHMLFPWTGKYLLFLLEKLGDVEHNLVRLSNRTNRTWGLLSPYLEKSELRPEEPFYKIESSEEGRILVKAVDREGIRLPKTRKQIWLSFPLRDSDKPVWKVGDQVRLITWVDKIEGEVGREIRKRADALLDQLQTNPNLPYAVKAKAYIVLSLAYRVLPGLEATSTELAKQAQEILSPANLKPQERVQIYSELRRYIDWKTSAITLPFDSILYLNKGQWKQALEAAVKGDLAEQALGLAGFVKNWIRDPKDE